jgi:hypothetical protein
VAPLTSKGDQMMQHKYQIGQIVDLISAPQHSNRPSGPCRILLRLPFERARLQYRVQSMAEKNQRVVFEEDLRPSPSIEGRAGKAAAFKPLRMGRA